ncbi:MAG: ComEC/Rec2 family competence protein [Pirellulales bacterium]
MRVFRSFGRYGSSALVVTAAVWCVTLPLVMHRFHLLSPAAFGLNLLLLPPVAVGLLSGFGVLVCAVAAPPLVAPFGAACATSLGAAQWLVDRAGDIPGAYMYVPGPPGWWVVGFYAGAALFVLSPRLRRARTAWLAGALVWVSAGLGASLVLRGPGRGECVFLDVGHGLAAVLRTPEGHTLLYDAGHLGQPHRAGQVIASYLWSRGIGRIDAVILSHADVDHFNALPYLTERFAVGQVLVAPSFADLMQPAVAELCQRLRQRGVPIRFCWSGDAVRVGSAMQIDVLHPPAVARGETDNANSLVASVAFQGRRILLTGDLEGAGLQRLLQMPRRKHDVLLAPHHGSDSSNPPGLLEWASPTAVVVSQRRAGRGPSKAIAAYRRQGVRVASTAVEGALLVQFSRAGIELEPVR